MITRPHFWIAAVTAAIILSTPLAQARPELEEQTAALHREIAALRIVHGLDLSAEQIEEIIPLVRPGIGLREDLDSVMESAGRDNLPVLEQVRDDLSDDGELSEETRTAAEDARKVTEKAMRPVHVALRELGEEVMDLLDDEQREQVMGALAPPEFGPRWAMRGHDGDEEEPMGQPPGVRGGRPMQPELGGGGRSHDIRHNARQLFGVVFSDEFLAVLEAQVG